MLEYDVKVESGDDDRNDDEVMDEFVVMSGSVAVDLMLDDAMKNDDKVDKNDDNDDESR